MDAAVKEKLEKYIAHYESIIEKIEAAIDQVAEDQKEEQLASLNRYREELAYLNAQLAVPAEA